MSLVSKDFVASDADVEALARAVYDAIDQGENGRRTYLKSLVATTQNELGSKPRIRNGTAKTKLDAVGIELQLKALTQVHERFYAVVTRVAAESVPPGTKDKGIEVNRRTNFARTAMSAIRTYVRAGNDLTSIGLQSLTKASLSVVGPRASPPKSRVLMRRAELQSKTLMSTLMMLADTDREVAVAEMQAILGQITEQLAGMGVGVTERAERRAVIVSRVPLEQQARAS